MAAPWAPLDLMIERNDPTWEFRLRVRGPNLTNVAMRAQIRARPDAPGAPLVSLETVTNANAEGIRLAGVQVVDGVNVNDVRVRLNLTTRRALPYAGEVGTPSPLAWALTLGGVTRLRGTALVLATPFDSDAAPASRPPSRTSAVVGATGSAGATLTISDLPGATVSIEGLDLIPEIAAPILAVADALGPAVDKLNEIEAVADALPSILLAAGNASLVYAQATGGYPTRAAGEAGAQMAQAFKVVTAAGEADIYRKTETGSVWLGKSLPDDREDATQLKLAEASQLAPSWPIQPAVEVQPTDAIGYGGRQLPGRGRAPSRNLLAYNSGFIAPIGGFAGQVTQRFGPGRGAGKAVRIKFTTAAQAFTFISNEVLPAGTYTHSVWVRSAPGAGTQPIKYGRFMAANQQDFSVSEDAWTQLPLTVTVNGTAAETIQIKGDGTNMPDLVIDENWLSADGAPPEPFVFDAGSAMPIISKPGRWPAPGNFVDPGSSGILKGPAWPDTIAATELTILFAFRRFGRPAAKEWMVLHPNSANVVSLGIETTGVLSTKPLTNNPIGNDVCDGNWHVAAVRMSASEQSNWLDAMQVLQSRSATGELPLPPLSHLVLFASGAPLVPAPSGQFGGDFGGMAVWTRALTDDQLIAATVRMQRLLELRGFTDPLRGAISPLFDGDSRTARINLLGDIGDSSYAFQLLGNKDWTDGVTRFGANFAESGDGIDNLRDPTDQMQIQSMLASIRGARAMGRVPVAHIWVGVNESGTIIADPAGWVTNKLNPYLQQLRAAGARTVVASELPGVGGARAPGQNVAWYNAVQTIRGILLTSPLVDAVADFGEPGSLMGAINAPYDLAGTYYETDNYHVRGPGQSELRPRSWAAITMAGAKG